MPNTRLTGGLPCAVEALEPRRMLAGVDLYVTVFHDRNLNGRRDAGEPGMPNWDVEFTYLRDAELRITDGRAKTDASGVAHRVHYREDLFDYDPHATIVKNGYWCTTTSDSSTAGYSVRRGTRTGYRRVDYTFGVADRGPMRGLVRNLITYPNGTTSRVPLAGRRVFEDRNANGKFDRGEPSGITDDQGIYSIPLTAGTHVLHVQTRKGWKPTAASSDIATAVAGIYARPFPTMSVMMDRPTVIDVLAVYTPAARGTLSKSRMSARVAELFAFANGVYGNSDTNVLLNPVRIDGTSYVESGNLETDLIRLKEPRDSFLDEVHRTRDAGKADLAVLLTEKSRSPGETVGLGYQYHPHVQQHTLGFSAVALTGDKQTDWSTLAHEIGHNLGAGHEAGVDGDAPTKPYAQGLVSSHSAYGYFKDVMSHGPGTMLPFFSSPRIETSFGAIFGDAATADNARIIREVTPVVAKYR